ncbi:MAG TPA: hypothetical protein VFR37_15165 [Longimicrobium sp.]|nr:hypothetical protein [Longimicrobium sp.]
MRISPLLLTSSLVLASATPSLAQSFASRIHGTWQGGYCGNSTTTFRISTRTPQQSWVTERWCNAFACGDLDYVITEIDPAARTFVVHALEGTAFSSGGYDIHFQVSADGTTMAGAYVGHQRCQGSELSKVSADPGSGPLFTASIAPLPSADRPAVRSANIPPGLQRRGMADDTGSTACLVVATDEETVNDYDAYGRYVNTYVVGSMRWVYNRCTRAAAYSMPARGDARTRVTIASGQTHHWACSYRATYTPFVGSSTEVAYCDQRW